jgi:hypothetical protein
MAKIKVKLEVVGLFFRKEVEVEEGCSVADVLAAAKAASAGTAMELDYVLNGPPDPPSLRSITVHHRGPAISSKLAYATGQARQYPPGSYGFDDKVDNAAIPGPLQLVWQYYILSETKVEKSNDGKEIPCGLSNDPSLGKHKKQFNEGDVIRWRLVGIMFGPNKSYPKKAY